MINKENFLNEVESIANNSEVKEDLMLLLNLLDENSNINIDGTFLSDKIVKELFNDPHFNQLMIPWNFLETEIGRALMQAKFAIQEEKLYFVKDLERITGKGRAFISLEFKNGVIKGEKRGGKVVFKEKDVIEYLNKRGYPNELENKRVNEYEEAKEMIISGDFEREATYEVKRN